MPYLTHFPFLFVSPGKTSFNHVGNRRFRDLIAANTDKYNNAKSRLEKSMVVHCIVEEVKKVKGRFLKQDRFSGRWYELDERQAKEKVGHAIRDATSSIDPKKKVLKKTRSKGSPVPSSPVKSSDFPVIKEQQSSSKQKRFPPRADSVSSTHSDRTVKSDNTSDPWDDLEPLHVDSFEAQNSLADLQKDDLFLRQMDAVLGAPPKNKKGGESAFYTPFRFEVV